MGFLKSNIASMVARGGRNRNVFSAAALNRANKNGVMSRSQSELTLRVAAVRAPTRKTIFIGFMAYDKEQI